MKQYLVAAILFASLLFISNSAANDDVGQRLMAKDGHWVVELTPPSNPRTGGTGFGFQAPSGRYYTLTNRHICKLAENGMLAAHYNENPDRAVLLRVIEISDTTDLCLVEGLPDNGGLQIADDINERAQEFVIGHPHLNPLTFSAGYITARHDVQIADEAPQEACHGEGREWKTVQTFLGPMDVCIVTVDAYDTSIVIYPGNSGSPVLDLEGKVIGVVFAGDNQTNMGATIPLDVVKAFISLY